jgi:hypothetical protein
MEDRMDFEGAPPGRSDPMGDYQRAFAAGRMMGAGPPDAQSRFQGLAPGQLMAASQAQDKLAAILHGLALATPDPRQRLAMAQHIAARNPQFGIHPDSLTPEDLTNQGIAGHIASILAAKQQIDSGARAAAATQAPAAAPDPRSQPAQPPSPPAASPPPPHSGALRQISNSDLRKALGL